MSIWISISDLAGLQTWELVMIRGNENTKSMRKSGEKVEELKQEAFQDKAVGEKIRNPQMRLLRSGQ